MTEISIWRRRCATALGLIFPLVLMLGCGTTTRPEPQLPIATIPEARPEAKTDSSPLPSIAPTPSDAKQDEIAYIDEERSIFFSLGSKTINPMEKVKLRRIASILKNDKSLFVTLAGRANDNGSRSFNLAVADARVESVSSFLRKLGVGPRQITKLVIGGEETPSACQSADCRQRMRRVELTISPSEKARASTTTQDN